MRAISVPLCFLSIAFSLVLAGCAPDTRMSYDLMQALEERQLVVEPVAVQPEQLALTELHPYTVGPGDVLALTMVGLVDPFSETRIVQRVDQNGRISLPLPGEIEVAGLDLAGVEAAVKQAHVPAFVRVLTVYAELLGPEGTTVVVIGAAGEPGLVSLPGNRRNVVYALAQTAGYSAETSGLVRVLPIQPERPEQVYNLRDVNDLRRALLAPPLESGDMVVVEAASESSVYVTGLVNAPGPVLVPPGGAVSLVRAIAATGGLRDFLEPPEATLWRELPDGRRVRAKIELASIMGGDLPDITLRAGDVLDVPHTPETRFREWVASNIRIGPFGVTAVYDPVADYRARILRDDRGSDRVIRNAVSYEFGTALPSLLLPPSEAPTAP